MLMKLSLIICCLLFFVDDGCGSKSDGQPARPAATPSASATPTAVADSNSAARSAVDACALLEKSEIQAVQGQPVNEAKPSRRDDDMLLTSQCFYMTAVYSSSVSLEVSERNPKNPDQDILNHFWAERFEGAKSSKKKEKPRLVAGVGDKAYWVGNDRFGALYALKRDKLLRISLGGPDVESAKMEKSKRLAEKALARLE